MTQYMTSRVTDSAAIRAMHRPAWWTYLDIPSSSSRAVPERHRWVRRTACTVQQYEYSENSTVLVLVHVPYSYEYADFASPSIGSTSPGSTITTVE